MGVVARGKERASEHFSTASAAAMETGKTVIGKSTSYAQDVQDQLEERKELYMDMMEKWLKIQLQKQSEWIIDRLPGLIKDLLEDPDMPRFISKGKDRAIDGLWPDVREEIVWETAVFIDGQPVDERAEEIEKSAGVDCFRAFIRYHLFPYDQSFWVQLKDPVYIIFLIGCSIPVAGFYAFVFFLLFFLIDFRDEFQLIQYILTFKGFQFFTHGILRTVIGFWTFVACATAPGDLNQNSCDKDGPGVTGPYPVIIGGWFLQSIMVFVAFFCLRCSKEKGRAHLEVTEVKHTGVTASGGYLYWFMVYDGVCFAVCLAALILITLLSPGGLRQYDEWYKKHAAFCVQVVYGYLSLPFAIFKIPVLVGALTHSVPTAYDRKGRCRHYVGPPRPEKGTVYLPKKFKGVHVLTPMPEPGPDGKKAWLVDSSKVKPDVVSEVAGLTYYGVKTTRDELKCRGPKWGETVFGEEEGAWIKCKKPPNKKWKISPEEAEELLNRVKSLLLGRVDLLQGKAEEMFSVAKSKVQDGAPRGSMELAGAALGTAQAGLQVAKGAAAKAAASDVGQAALQTVSEVVDQAADKVGLGPGQAPAVADRDLEGQQPEKMA